MVRSLVAVPLAFLLLCLSCPAQAPPDETRTFRSEELNLRLIYPSILEERDASQATQGGQLNLLGVSADADPALAHATKCLHPVLLLGTPEGGQKASTPGQAQPDGGTRTESKPGTSATVLLAELDTGCLSGEEQMKATDLLSRLAEVVAKTPGMSALTQPAWYNVGWQKVHMAAAQGRPQIGGQPALSTIYSMAISTNWSNHLLVWFFSSNELGTLDRITKINVRFGRQDAAPLYPLTVGNAGAAAH